MRSLVARSVLTMLVLHGALAGTVDRAGEHKQVLRGWISDEQCARGRAESGVFTGTNPRCAKECVAKGKKVVLIDPDHKRVLDIANPETAKKNIGDYVQVAGTERRAGTLQIESLTRLAPGQALCSREPLKK